MNYIEVKNLKKTFKEKGKIVKAVRGISFGGFKLTSNDPKIPETKYIKGRLLGKLIQAIIEADLETSEIYEVHKIIVGYINKRREN